MKQSGNLGGEVYVRKNLFRKRWHKVMMVLSSIVVFCTTYALILPAITMERGSAHIHDDSCYTQLLSAEITSPICSEEQLSQHQHEAGCFNSENQPACGYADFVVHHHDAGCFDADGQLWCYLAEISEHTHTVSCFAVPQPHIHGDECYVTETADLICGFSGHTEDCWTETRTLICEREESQGHNHADACFALMDVPICGRDESDGHQHDDSCRNENGEWICGREEQAAHKHSDSCFGRSTEPLCGQEEREGHSHSDGCWQVSRELTCTDDSHHVHGEDCYSLVQILACEREETPADAPVEPVLICEKKEIQLHRHGEGCFDANGLLICNKTEILQHVHGDDCFLVEEISLDTELLTCTVPEGEGSHVHGDGCFDEHGNLTCQLEESAGHQHSQRCYGTWELTCGQDVQSPSDDCPAVTEPRETAAAETTQEPSHPTAPEGLPVMGTVYAEPTPNRMLTRTIMAGAERQAASPVDVSGYITGAVLSYKTTEAGDWMNAEGKEDIPGDAFFRILVEYTGVPIDNILFGGCSMTYTLPPVFRDAVAEGVIKDETEQVVGSITTSGSVATIVFQEDWLRNQKTETNTVLGGDFYVEGRVNLSEIPGGGETTVTIGNITITLDFAEDILARYGDVEIAKSLGNYVLEEETGDYLQYTLTVTAKQDGCPDVTVTDEFLTGKDYLEKDQSDNPTITVLSPENARIGFENGKMIWTIGQMDPGETRTLTYKVKLLDTYTGIKAKGNIGNTAKVYSKTYERDSDTATFVPSAGATLSKVGTDVTLNPDGTVNITYYIWVNAYETNNYTLDNVKIVDSLDGKGSVSHPTNAEIRKHLLYKPDSFVLYEGGSKNQQNLNNLTEPAAQGNLVWGDDSNGDNKRNDSFSYYVGPMAPGDNKTLVYQITVEPGAYVEAGNEAVSVLNRAEIKSDDNRSDGNQWLNGYVVQKTLERKAWSRKLVGEEISQDQTITMSGATYDANGSVMENPGSFTAPAGSYQYQVVVNEASDWNFSAANLKDTLDAYMQFVGYVRVDTFDLNTAAPASSLADTAAIDTFKDKTPIRTFWVQVDGGNSFEVNPGTIPGTDQTHAYLLTYYAKPVNTEEITQVVVSNTFELNGTVGIGNYRYTLNGITARADVIVSGTNSFHAEKHAWYYEAPQVTSGDFARGSLYWAIQVDGNLIPNGTAIRDVTNQSGGTVHHIRGTSLAGVFVGNLGEAGFAEYANYSALISSGKLTPLETSAYTKTATNEQLTVTLNQDLRLGSDSSLYIIIKTEPSSLPQSDRDTRIFYNNLQSSSDGSSWVDHGTAQKTLYGSENIFKELGQVFTYTGTGNSITTVTNGTGAWINPAHLTGAGTYVAWQIHLNYEGSLSGTYRVLEQIPEGMEVAYIRTYWLGNKALSQKQLPATAEITDLGPGWMGYTKNMDSANYYHSYTTHYYISGQQVLMEYRNLFPGGERDEHAVEIQVVCKLTDPDVLLGGETKNFNNVVRLCNADGQEIGSDSHGVTLSAPRLSKGKDNSVSLKGGQYPFVITLNELGTDLMPGADTITLVDELGPNLTIDSESIKVVNTRTQVELEELMGSVELDSDGTQTLKIILPDNEPLTITYTVVVNAPPEQSVTISNNAHWEGYATSTGGAVNDSGFKYTSAGGTVGGATTPTIRVLKKDQYNISKKLSGAVFQLTEMVLSNGVLVEKSDGTSISGTTGDDGIVTFGQNAEALLAFNTVYRIMETKAPDGYVLDGTPHYVLIVYKGNQEEAEPDYAPYRNAGVRVYHDGVSYTYEAWNQKGEIQVVKQFANVDGSAVGNLNGTYSFGLFTDEAGTDKVMETKAVIEAGELTVKPRFFNVNLDRTYYVYELDDQGRPIKGGAATVSGIPFMVSYSTTFVTVTAEQSKATVTVTNRMNYAELPQTGGIGTEMYTTAGLLLIVLAVLLLYSQRKCRKEGLGSS